MSEPVRKVGPYKLLRRIGRGAFGVVWLAERQSAIATMQVALKLPRDEDIDLEAFKNEAVIWVHASGHSNVVSLIEADIYDDHVVIVSEYMPDGSLAGWLKQHGGKAPSIESACEILKGVLAGLSHLHERHIIHRDLKPDNILMQRDTPRLADFGIARLLRSGSYSSHISGTWAYMAPEAFDGKRNERTDIWAVGVIFYQLLAGRLPYDQQDSTAMVGAIMRDEPPRLPDSLPEVLRRVAMKALQRDPTQRYASASEVLKDLREAERTLWLNRPHPDDSPITVPVPPNIPTIPGSPPVVPPIEPISPEDVDIEPHLPRLFSRFQGWSTKRYVALGIIGFLLVASPIVGFIVWDRTSTHGARLILKTGSVPLFVIFSPDGKTILNINEQPLSIQLWSVDSGVSRLTLQGEQTTVSPNGKTVAISDGKVVRLLDSQMGALQQTLSIRKSDFAQWSQDGRTLATYHDGDKNIMLWDVKTGTAKERWKPQVGFPLALSSNAKILATSACRHSASSCNDVDKISLWDELGTLKQQWQFPGSVSGALFSPDGEKVAVKNFETCKLWDVESGTLKLTAVGGSGEGSNCLFSPNGQTLVTTDSRNLSLWDAQTGTLKMILDETDWSGWVLEKEVVTKGLPIFVAFSPDGRTLASGRGFSIRIWDLEKQAQTQAQTGQLTPNSRGEFDIVLSLAFSPDGKRLAAGSLNRSVKLWDVK